MNNSKSYLHFISFILFALTNLNRFCILDTFAGLPLVNYWDVGGHDITVLLADTFKLKAGSNTIYVYNSNIDTVQPGTFVLPGTGDIRN